MNRARVVTLNAALGPFEEVGRPWGELLAWAEAGEIRPHVEARYPLEQAHEAMRAKWSSRYVGGVVLNP